VDDLLDMWSQNLDALCRKALGHERAQPAMFRWIVAVHAARGVFEHRARTVKRPSALRGKGTSPNAPVLQHRRDVLVAGNQPSHLAAMQRISLSDELQYWVRIRDVFVRSRVESDRSA